MMIEAPSVRVLCGERSIGGTIIVVEQDRARLYIDTGLRYDPAADKPEVKQPPRGLYNHIRLGITVNIPDLYSPEDIPLNVPAILPPTDGPVAVVFTHSHLDHTTLTGYIKPEVPKYATATTERIIYAHSDTARTLTPVKGRFTRIVPNQEIEVGGIKFRLGPGDHDVPDSKSVIWETRDGTGAYTGDYSLHSHHPEQMTNFIRAARDAKIKILITEGVSLRLPRDPNEPPQEPLKAFREEEVAPQIKRILSETKGLAVMLLMPDNAERLEAITRAVAESGRMMVIDADGLLYGYSALGRPIDAPHKLFLPNDDLEDEFLRDRLMLKFNSLPEIVTAEEIGAHPAEYALRLEFRKLSHLQNILPGQHEGVLIHSGGLPIGPFDPDWKNMLETAQKLNLKFNSVYCNGHASPEELAQVTREIDAPSVMVVHSFNPQLFPTDGGKLLLPVRGQRYEMRKF